MTAVSEKLTKQFHDFVAQANPSTLHEMDESRLYDALVALHKAGHEVDEQLIEKIWPKDTDTGAAEDPAHSDYVKARAMSAANVAGEIMYRVAPKSE